MSFSKQLDEIIGKFYNTYERMKKKPRYYGCGILLYPSDIHMIEMIVDYPDANTTELAEKQGVTKGTVSKLTKKLENKGFLKKYQYTDNKKEIYYKLTELGKNAYKGHIEYHKKRDMHAYVEFENYSNEQKKFLLEFFERQIDYLSQYIE